MAHQRWMIVAIRTPALKIDVMSIHAPVLQRGCPLSMKEGVEFWKEIEKGIKQKTTNKPIIILMDANTRLGKQTSPAVGNLAPDEVNMASTALHDMLLRHNLSAVNTFSHIHQGRSHTWENNQGHHSRIDYVCVPTKWLPMITSSWVDPTVDNLNKVPDHSPVVATFRARSTAHQEFRAGRRPKCKFDKRKPTLRALQEYDEFTKSMEQMPPIPWHMDAHRHAAQLATYIYQTSGRRLFLENKGTNSTKTTHQQGHPASMRRQAMGTRPTIQNEHQTKKKPYKSRIPMLEHNKNKKKRSMQVQAPRRQTRTVRVLQNSPKI